jgi:molybdopterin biosynthesis enzyme
MIREAVVIPTGDEVRSGIVKDTDSPEILSRLVARYPCCRVTRVAPVADSEDAILREIAGWVRQGVELVVLVGGSGGGSRYSSNLADDRTHCALERISETRVFREIYGKNGHMWCKLVCGKKNGTLLINVPGPFVEARAAFEAFLRVYPTDDLQAVNKAMIDAVLAQYPVCARSGLPQDAQDAQDAPDSPAAESRDLKQNTHC